MADRIRRLDERASDIVVADDAELEGHTRLLGVADGRRHPGIRHRHDEIAGHAALACQLCADALTCAIDAAALDDAVGAREIDVFEDTELRARSTERLGAANAGFVDHHHLARLDIAHDLGADDIEGAALGGEDGATVERADRERPYAAVIAHPDHRLVGEYDQGVCALELA